MLASVKQPPQHFWQRVHELRLGAGRVAQFLDKQIGGKELRGDCAEEVSTIQRAPVNFVLPGQENVYWELNVETSLEDGFLETPKLIALSGEYENTR